MTDDLSRDLRVLICEDEYLLALDLAQQLETFGAVIAGLYGNLAELEKALADPAKDADVAFLDVQLADGTIYDVVPYLERRGIAIIFCSGYPPADRPEALAHLPWLNKPFRAQDVLQALHEALAARGDN